MKERFRLDLLATLGLPRVDCGPLRAEDAYYRAVYAPSFEPPFAIELRVVRGDAHVEVTLSRVVHWRLWGVASVLRAESAVSAQILDDWRRDLGAVDPLDLADGPEAVDVLDGTMLLGEARAGARYACFEAEMHFCRGPWRRYFVAMRRLAMRAIPEPDLPQQIRELGRPLRAERLDDLGGSPRWLRVYEAPRRHEQVSAFYDQLRALDPHEPWLVDLRDLRLGGFDAAHLLRLGWRIAWRPGAATVWLPGGWRDRVTTILGPFLARRGVSLR